ncbi:MAG: CesT family type III secretion system chaperone [Pseudomonadota bacterium]
MTDVNVDPIQAGLEELGHSLGFELGLDDDNACAIEFADGLVCTIEYVEARDALFLWTELLTVPENDHDHLLLKALTINANPFQTGGTAIGYDADRSCLTLSFLCPASRLDAADVSSTIGTFVIVATDLIEALRADEAAPTDTTATRRAAFRSRAIIRG